jgi:two-component system, sensor histidine kinase PdtaS
MIEANRIGPERTLPKLANDLQQMRPHDHLCLIYESSDEWRFAAIPFILIGLKRNEKCIYVVDSHTSNQIRGFLIQEGIDAKALEQSGQLVMLRESEAYTKDGSFDPDKMISLLARETQRAIAEGYTALRVTGEMTWVLRGGPGSERLIEYEAKLNRDFFTKYPCIALCQYDKHRFPPDIIADVLRTHSKVIMGGKLRLIGAQ